MPGAVKVNVGTAAAPVWVYLGGGGGVIICTSTTRPGAPTTGMEIYETDTGLTWVWTGAAWTFKSCWTLQGSANSGVLVASTAKPVTVTFATPFPANSPTVRVVGVPSVSGLGSTPLVAITGASRTGFTMNFYRTNTTAFDALWIATNSPLDTTS